MGAIATRATETSFSAGAAISTGASAGTTPFAIGIAARGAGWFRTTFWTRRTGLTALPGLLTLAAGRVRLGWSFAFLNGRGGFLCSRSLRCFSRWRFDRGFFRHCFDHSSFGRCPNRGSLGRCVKRSLFERCAERSSFRRRFGCGRFVRKRLGLFRFRFVHTYISFC